MEIARAERPTAGDGDAGSSTPRSVAASSATVAAWTMVSRITGLARVVVIGAVLGPTFLANTFLATNTVPNLTFAAVAGPVLGLVLVPSAVDALLRRGTAAGRLHVRRMSALLITAAGGVAVYAYLYTTVLRGFARPNLPPDLITAFEGYTGVSYGDTGFTEAAATIGAQTGLSTYVSLAAFGLILFLAPPGRFFASWTRPTGDRRPALLVVGLVAVFVVVLFVPALSDYFGLTGPAPPVFEAVLPALAIWFAALTAAYRFRLLDRLLGLDDLPRTRRPGR